MDKKQVASNSVYQNLVTTSDNFTEIVGRLAKDSGKEGDIIKDIHRKMNFTSQKSLLDIGCGFGNLALHFIDYTKKNKIKLTLVDIDAVIERIESDHRFNTKNVKMIKGTFPDSLFPEIKEKYDYILVYSVLHYTDKPDIFIEKLVPLLRPGGIILIGDLPNINRMGRFQSTEYGRNFTAEYKGMLLSEIPLYKDHHEFYKSRKNELNNLISDELIFNTINKYRDLGYDVWVVPQPDELPFCKSREDLLIKNKME